MQDLHEIYMQRCFELAKKAIGKTSPNPYVGAVIVKDGKIIGEGFHQKSGMPHAEIEAINNATESVSGATLYCNLEPCCHTNKKTPPCAQKIIELGFSKVVIANLDPNPAVAGKGVELLKSSGIKVMTGILQIEGELLNEVFFTHITKKRPFIHLKWAQTLDGKIATLENHSQWITGSESRARAHKERALYDAILVGSATANYDDPSLTVRLDETYAKKRIVLSPSLKLRSDLKLFNDEFKSQTIVITNKTESFLDITTLNCPLADDSFDLDFLLKALYQFGIHSLYVEGGMHTISKFIDANLYDRISIFMGAKLLGPGVSLQTESKSKMHHALNFEQGQFQLLAKDLLFESKRNLCLQD